MSIVNLSVLKNDRARAIRFSTLLAICSALDCEIGDLLVREPHPKHVGQPAEEPRQWRVS